MIYFKKVRWQNFLSTGNQFTEIILNKSQSTLIVGENGAGKSTMLDAISFVLYGKPYRNINKPQLVNSITQKKCTVEIEFSIKGKEYMVRRGLKPNVFEIYCDDKMIDQNANVKEYQDYLEKNILKLNHKSFTQIVVIGSANFVPFMQMKVWDRRTIIEDLLDIEIFSKMFNLLKEKMTQNKEQISETKYKLDLLEQNIALTKKHMGEIMSLKRSDRTAKKNKIDELEFQIQDHHETLKELDEQVKAQSVLIADINKLKNKQKKMQELDYQINSKIEAISKEIQFFENNDECPTCQQEIDAEFKQHHIHKHNDKRIKLKEGMVQFEEEYRTLMDQLNEISQHQTKITEYQNQIMEENTSIRMLQNNILSLRNELDQEIASDDDSLETLKKLEKDLKDQQLTYKKALDTKEQYDVAASLLKDGGIKAKIIKQYVPIINKLVNKYLAAMEFFVQFELDEQFNEKIKSRFRDEFTYDSFSEGEKMRIDLSLLFTWRAVAKLRNSISTNLLIMDEVFDSSLDTTGTDEFLKIITSLSADTNTFVISHKGDQLFDKFHSNIRFEKVKNFSQIAA